jgi:Flp pilus assembly protein TadG
MNLSRAAYKMPPVSARGSVAVELALILSAMIFVLAAMFVFGNILLQYNIMKIASNGAASYMVASGEWRALGGATERAAAAAAMAKRLAQESGSSAANITVTVTCEPGITCLDDAFDSIMVGTDIRPTDPFRVLPQANQKVISVRSVVTNTNNSVPGPP